ncbi:hypothetical protein DLJ61_02775 [Gordonia terrae]|uniref:SipW-cognate class signal peptide n=3 Tax=Gordonia terrae TaxID=2055 RepID=A0AAD0K4H5_9ACTN|nr:hypothetical protein BCM27_02760 [Gordonia terrae]AWO82606.1 hypothetical protein DLJ61_02775 [Gordonia terrae]GAB46450.1 hypothetical protein GOTRE_159_00140 [Gordonia terrae NBRC 100016]
MRMSRHVFGPVAGAAALAVVVVLIAVSVRSTGAYWTETASSAPGQVATGRLALATGSGADNVYTFPELTGAALVPNQFRQAPLAIVNTGTTPLRYRLTSAGPQVSTASTVAVALAGAIGGTCTATSALGPTSAFPTLSGVGSVSTVASAFRTLAAGAQDTWCIRSTLISVAGAEPATYTHVFGFRAEQV